jgi:hypothetical protein
MENKINNLKRDFVKIIDATNRVTSIFEKLEVKIANITAFYVDLINKNKDKMYLFGLDSFRFQIALLDREHDETKIFFKVVNNRIYCEYYKFCKKMCEYISESYTEPNLINISKAINETDLPAYDSVDPIKEYGLCFVLTIHDNIIELLKCLHSHLLNKEHELKDHSTKRTMGLNIDNFVFTFVYNNSILRDKIRMFLEYMDFFHNMHLKNLNLIEKKLELMMSEINNDLNLDGNENSEVRNKKENDEISTDTDSISSSSCGNGSVIKEKKRERSPRKKDLEVTPKINIFFKKKENESETLLNEAELKENELMSKEDKFHAFVNFIASDVEKLLKSDNIELKIQENKKKKKTKK